MGVNSRFPVTEPSMSYTVPSLLHVFSYKKVESFLMHMGSLAVLIFFSPYPDTNLNCQTTVT